MTEASRRMTRQLFHVEPESVPAPVPRETVRGTNVRKDPR
jgi:hypothetical protein